ncbi:hypothetical protein J7L67_01975 [bacterium]|nr:hypothetical protein [bacterium]
MGDLISVIIDNVNGDEVSKLIKSRRLKVIYKSQDDAGKNLIDEVLICLCGQSFDGLKKSI